GLAGDSATIASVRPDSADCTVGAVVPGGVHQRPPVRRPRGIDLEVVAAGYPARSSIRQVLHVQLAKRGVCYTTLVGRNGHPAEHAHVELVRRNLLREAHGLGERLLYLGSEWNLRGIAAGNVHTPEPAPGPDHDLTAVRREGVAGVRAEEGPYFLLIMLLAVAQRMLAAVLDVVQHEYGGGVYPADERNGFSVRRRVRRQ